MSSPSPVRSTLSAQFSSVLHQALDPRGEIVDLGAGSDGSPRGNVALLAAKVRHVLAVDVHPRPAELPRNVSWDQCRIEDWLQERSFFPGDPAHAYVARNVLHFVDRDLVLDALLPELARTLLPGGVVAISTFHRQPDPPVCPPYPSLYRVADLRRSFPQDWNVVLGVEETLRGPGHDDRAVRDWHTTQLVIRKPR